MRHLFKTSTLCGSLGAVFIAGHISADTISFDGTTDASWTGANWTINAGPAGQVVPPSSGPSGNLIDFQYNGHDWTINGGTINEDVQIKLDGGSLDVTNSNVSLIPTSAGTGANLSGLNLGQDGTPTTALFTNSTIAISRSNQNGNALRVRNGSTLSLVGSTVNVSAEPGSGNLTVEVASSLSIDGASTVNVTGGLEVTSSDATVTVADGAVLDLGWLRLNSGGEAEQDLMLAFSGGAITFSNSNPLRDNSSFEGAFNWVALVGIGSVTHNDLSANDNNLAGKLAQGYFSIDGTRINPTLSNATDWTESANIVALNAELQTLAVDGKFFLLTSDGGEQTLTLVPEPSSLALLAIGGLSICGRRRR